MIWSIVVILVFLVLAALLSTAERKMGPTYAKTVLMSAPEREAYERLRLALPEYLIFAQVRVADFLEPSRRTNARGSTHIRQLSADFVICDQAANVTGVVEIDDRSHDRHRQRQRDTKKDAACKSAGITVTRWRATKLPTPEQMRQTLLAGKTSET